MSFLDSNNHVCFNQGSSNLINGGIYIFDKKALLKQNFNLNEVISLEKQIIPKLIRIKKIKGHIFNYPFIIGIPEDYKKAELFMKKIIMFSDYLKSHFYYKNNGKTIWLGNGGSAADAQHIAAEFAKIR